MDDFSTLQTSLSSALVATTRASGQLAAEDLAFHRSLDPALAASLDQQNARLLALAERLLHVSMGATGAASGGDAVRAAVGPHHPPQPGASTRREQQQQQQQRGTKRDASGAEVAVRLRDADALEARWRGVVDVVDSLLERADTSLDEFTGAVKRLSPGGEQQVRMPYLVYVASSNPEVTVDLGVNGVEVRSLTMLQTASKSKIGRSAKAFRDADIPKPQLLFEHVPQNNDIGPFRPLLTSKPHAIVPLSDSLELETDEEGEKQYRHPYQKEIEMYGFPDSVRTESDPVPYEPFEETTATLVDTPEALDEMIAELRTAREIAVDIEHHEKRTYVGLVSLMQISTPNKDWIVDTLKPWRRQLERLNEVFADPKIVKVLHGAYMDIIWLQRDLGIYVVGLFDTFHAARTLGYQGGSLAFLLQKFVNFDAQKQYQMADWRIRPLPSELFEYARSDTHFLLHIYSHMRNELLTRPPSESIPDPLGRVLQKSRETALQVYSHPSLDQPTGLGSHGWFRILTKQPAAFSPEQFAVFRATHAWRDRVARQEDESPTFVLANHALFAIARAMPMETFKLLSVAAPVSSVLRLRARELLSIIQSAKEEGETGPTMASVMAETDAINAARRGVLPADPPSTQTVTATLPPPDSHPALPAPTTSPKSGATTTAHRAPLAFAPSPTLRLNTSTFWGPVPCASAHDHALLGKSGLDLAIPLPPLTAEVFVEEDADATSPVAALPAQHLYQPATQRPQNPADDDGVFVVREAGGARSRTHRTEDEDEFKANGEGAVSTIAIDDPAEIEKRADEKAKKAEKAAKKMERSARKRAEREQRNQEDAGNAGSGIPWLGVGAAAQLDADGDVEMPFDYDAAPSVLHAQREGGGREKKGKEKKKEEPGFNPFARANEAPQGAPRRRTEGKGRGGTFWS